MKLFNTMSRQIEEFNPIKDKEVKLYTCGPTVYWYPHIGNMRTYVLEDVLRRYLEWKGFDVKHVMNITDVGHLVGDEDQGEDKVEMAALKEGKTAWEIAEFYTDYFKKSMELFKIQMPHVFCKATDHIKEQIDLIKDLEEKGFTYQTSDGIYFDTSKLDDYGKLAKLDIEGLKAGARVEMKEKRNPTDFALWKFSPADQKRQMEWESPWGVGFPGWHIECSAMAMKYLGETLDIHCGGVDHVPIHHTNEIAQSEASTGKTFASYWIHLEHLMVNGKKMSKSLGNFYTSMDLIEKGYDPRSIRLFFLMGHYRSQVNLTLDALDSAANGLERVDDFMDTLNRQNGEENDQISVIIEAFVNGWEDLMDDDLNTPEAVAFMFEFIKSVNKEISNGISSKNAEQVINAMKKIDEVFAILPEEKELPEDAKELIERRKEARSRKDFDESDRLRNELESMGIEVKDERDKSYYRVK